MELVKQVIKEIGNKSREFYEFVLPPIDMHLNDDNLNITIDIPGFEKNDIKLTLSGNILAIKAQKAVEESKSLIINQRPNRIDKKIRLPIKIEQNQEKIESAKLDGGVLTVIIPITQTKKDISIE